MIRRASDSRSCDLVEEERRIVNQFLQVIESGEGVSAEARFAMSVVSGTLRRNGGPPGE